MRKFQRYHLIQEIKLASAVTGQRHVISYLMDAIRRTQYHFCDIPAKNAKAEPTHKGTSVKHKLSNILQNK